MSRLVKVTAIDYWPAFWPQDRPWANRYPGAWGFPVRASTPCLVCRQPGYIVPCPPEVLTAAPVDDDLGSAVVETESTCPGHEYAVRKFLAQRFAPRFAALVDAEATERYVLAVGRT